MKYTADTNKHMYQPVHRQHWIIGGKTIDSIMEEEDKHRSAQTSMQATLHQPLPVSSAWSTVAANTAG
jgi:hypothetical protein